MIYLRYQPIRPSCNYRVTASLNARRFAASFPDNPDNHIPLPV